MHRRTSREYCCRTAARRHQARRPDELGARKRIIISELERRFGSLDAALAQEYTGSHPSEDLRLFGAYHDVMLLLGE